MLKINFSSERKEWVGDVMAITCCKKRRKENIATKELAGAGQTCRKTQIFIKSFFWSKVFCCDFRWLEENRFWSKTCSSYPWKFGLRWFVIWDESRKRFFVREEQNLKSDIDRADTESLFIRFWGEDDIDRVSVTSRKMITYTRFLMIMMIMMMPINDFLYQVESPSWPS